MLLTLRNLRSRVGALSHRPRHWREAARDARVGVVMFRES